MNTTYITRDDLNDRNEYAVSDDLHVGGHIEIADGLDCVRFRGSLVATGRVVALAGSGITAAATFQPFAPRTRVIHEPRYLSGDALLRDMRDGGFDRLTVTRQPDGSVVVEFAFREDE